MNLSKSKYCQAVKCDKLLWLDEHKPSVKEKGNEAVLKNGQDVGELAKKIFGNYINIDFNKDLSVMIEDTKKALNYDNVVIAEASFSYQGLFCSVDILKKDNDKYELYEVKSTTTVHDIYLDDIAFQTYLLKKINLNITNSYIVYLNNDYRKKDTLNLKELFKIENVNELIKEKILRVPKKLEEIKKYRDLKEEPEKKVEANCLDCLYFKYCTRNLPENNIFTIRGMNKNTKIKYYNLGKISFEDLIKEKINPNYKIQIEHELNNKETYINNNKIKEFMANLYYPLCFLDFETFQQVIPLYDNDRVYEVIPFQYSLHIINKSKGQLIHKEFLAEPNIDPRRKLALRLIKDIPKNACILAYNSQFEKSVIKRLANIYPDIKEDLFNIYDNIFDLMIPFKEKSYYNKAMKGAYSIKFVLPALFPGEKDLDYHNLEGVHNGTEAMASFNDLANKTGEEKRVIRKNLLRYCKLDTYAMVKIYEKLEEIIDEIKINE